MEVLKGIAVANAINEQIMAEAKGRKRPPHLAIVRVGERGDDVAYERGATKKMEKVGFDCTHYSYPEDITNEEFIREFSKINANPQIDGILLLRPLPKHLDEKQLTEMIDPKKDIDG
ncbi:MAG: bifunctional 5,10-methylene-tetrahydrofolate dehydrogenase/5,10-methylene-tetrahydrofolate cyclohydrolase, partial [Lachnospiraceae bacterium]|nr:bifunctional 5,10-methylene-tetrahydrofolate dehydrogenase/5,10-methylene-tetrahydrofolate cyclohydrolase [Lachnospiraceae bacterium]